MLSGVELCNVYWRQQLERIQRNFLGLRQSRSFTHDQVTRIFVYF
jgi:hypothetical protein